MELVHSGPLRLLDRSRNCYRMVDGPRRLSRHAAIDGNLDASENDVASGFERENGGQPAVFFLERANSPKSAAYAANIHPALKDGTDAAANGKLAKK